jgi:hypothetical protein
MKSKKTNRLKNPKFIITPDSKKKTLYDLQSMAWSGEVVAQAEKLAQAEKVKQEQLKTIQEETKKVVYTYPFGGNTSPYWPNAYSQIPVAPNTVIKRFDLELGPISTTNKKLDKMLPDHIHSEIEIALNVFDPLFLKRYSGRKIESLSWNRHDGTILAPLAPLEGEIPIIEYKFADQLLKLEEELTPRVVSDQILESVMKMCLHAKDM